METDEVTAEGQPGNEVHYQRPRHEVVACSEGLRRIMGQPADPGSEQATLSTVGHTLAALGPRTEELVRRYFPSALNPTDSGESTLFGDLASLADFAISLQSSGWSDANAVPVVDEFLRRATDGTAPDAATVRRWVQAMPNEPEAVLDCLQVDPPEGVTILRLLSRAGSQKLVFTASWELTQREIVLKKLLVPEADAAAILRRESQAHPLSIRCPNIIETHLMSNGVGEQYLIEEKLPEILHDKWEAGGSHEAANLLVDVAAALRYLHGELHLVHGDIKPDNIGRRGASYILLDFGICREIDRFTRETSGTGSLRTRAPELLATDRYETDPCKADVWALGATVFNSMIGRYPLFDPGEQPPRVSTPAERELFEGVLRDRVNQHYEQYVDLSKIAEPLKSVLSQCLAQDPDDRLDAASLVDLAHAELAAYIRSADTDQGKFAPIDEIESYMESLDSVDPRLMPISVRRQYTERLQWLMRIPAISDEQRSWLSAQVERLDAA